MGLIGCIQWADPLDPMRSDWPARRAWSAIGSGHVGWSLRSPWNVYQMTQSNRKSCVWQSSQIDLIDRISLPNATIVFSFFLCLVVRLSGFVPSTRPICVMNRFRKFSSIGILSHSPLYPANYILFHFPSLSQFILSNLSASPPVSPIHTAHSIHFYLCILSMNITSALTTIFTP